MRKLRDRLTYANVMSTIAVFLVLAGGSAVALINGKKLKNGTVSTKKLHKAAVTNPKLAAKAVDTENIGDKSVKQGKLGDGAVITEKIGDLAVTNKQLGVKSVTTPKLADQAVGAAQLDYGSVGLLRSGRVISSPVANQTLTPPLLSAGGVTVSGSCSLDAGGTDHTAAVSVSGAAGSVFTEIESGPTIVPTGNNGSVGSGSVGAPLMASGLNSTRKLMVLTVVTPTSVLSLNILVAINTPSFNTPCVFAATGTLS